MIKTLSLFLLLLCVSPSWALDNSVDKEVTVTGGSTIGTPPPLTCIGNNALQWDGTNWQCSAMTQSGGVATMNLAESTNSNTTAGRYFHFINLAYSYPLRSLRHMGAGAWVTLSAAQARDFKLYINGRAPRFFGGPYGQIYGNRINLTYGSYVPRVTSYRLVFTNRHGLRDRKGRILANFDVSFR